MFGTFIEKGISNWQIVQHHNGYAKITLSGNYITPKVIYDLGIKSSIPIIRVVDETNNLQILPYQESNYIKKTDYFTGFWDITIKIPAGGPYRIETALKIQSSKTQSLQWIIRGDIRFHVGIGDVFVVAGQSNSSGYGNDSIYDPPSIGVHIYNNSKKWDLATHPISDSTNSTDEINTEMGISGTSPYLSFGKNFKKISKYPVGIIYAALGGSFISSWCPSKKGDLFFNMINRIKDSNSKVKGILWYQGESDTSKVLAKKYLNNFKEFVLESRKELGYDLPVFTFQLNRQIKGDNNIGWGIVREAQRRASYDISDVYVLPTIDCSLSDVVHNDSRSNVLLGERLAKMCGHVFYSTKEFFAPSIKSATFKDNKVNLYFDNVKGSLTLYSDSPKDNSFLVKDEKGDIKIKTISTQNTENNKLILTLERKPTKNPTVSFAYTNNPTNNPFVDNFSYLPALAFFEFPIEFE